MKRPLLLYILCLLHLFLGINGMAGGGLLLLEPDGSLLKMEREWLTGSPFNSFLFPGLLLFIFIGILPLVTIIGLIKKPNWSLSNILNLYRDRHWAWTFSLYTGIITITWITVQQVLTSSFWIQPVITFNGLLIIVCTMMPQVMKYFEKENLKYA